MLFTPPPNLTATEWANEHFYLSPESSAEPGKYNSARTPYIRTILDELTNPKTDTIVLRGCRQVVKTTVILIGIGMSMDIDPCPMLLLEPTLDLAERVSKRRIAPMIRDSQVLSKIIGTPRSRDADNTILNKTFRGGALTISGANSPSGLISEPRKKLFFDEVDYYPPTVGQQGDPIATALQCTISFWDRKVVYVSRPSVKNLSRIDACIEASDERYFNVPCHACRKKQKLEWQNVKWDSGRPETAVYVCRYCAAAWDDPQRLEAMTDGEWIAEREFNGMAGFSINGIYSIWRPLSVMVKHFLEANEKKKQGNLQPLRDWENDELGQSWEDEAEKTVPEPLFERRENYSASALPWRILYLTAGIDVQDDRLEIEIVGWRATKREEPEESWGVDDIVLYFDKATEGAPRKYSKLWETGAELDELLKREYRTEDGRKLRISAVCIDSGGHHTDEVYRFCNRRLARHIYAIKGADGSRPIWPHRAGKSKKYKGSLVWIVGVDTAKDAIYSSLRVAESGPGYSHFPVAYEIGYFQQLSSEQVRTKYRNGRPVRYWFKPAGVRNEALDRRVYALAALRSRPVPWEILIRSAPTEPPPETPGIVSPGSPEEKPLPEAPKPPKLGGRKTRFRFPR